MCAVWSSSKIKNLKILCRYISIRIPSVSENENHPFSIASAPGDEELQVVIKVVGDWTGELRRQVENGTVCPGIMVTVFGPYGAPAQQVFKHESVILVCGGIGVTPFASILQFFNSNHEHDAESFDYSNPKHGHTPGRSRAITALENSQMNNLTTLQQDARTREVLFIWVCSDLSSLSWFTKILKGAHDLIAPSYNMITSLLFLQK
jgi:ferredoxin-NADP reductase